MRIEKIATKHLAILQTCLPDYRLPFFEKLISTLPKARLVTGQNYFTPNLSLCTTPASWRSYVVNQFLVSRSLLWQRKAYSLTKDAEVVIAEFNPRILSTWVMLLWRRLSGRRTLLWGHLWGQHGPQWMVRHFRLFMLQLGDGMICYTRSQQEELNRMLPGHPAWSAGNSCVSRSQCYATLAPTTGPCVTYVGRLIKGKKPALLIEAFARAVDRLPGDAKLLLIGDGGEWITLIARVKELGLSNRVELPGHVGDLEQLKRIYSRSLVAVSPGYVGLSAIQSMAFGVPMLVSRNEPHSPEIEACVEGKTAVFFETDNVDSLADKLVGFFASDSPWRAKRDKISLFIADNYTFDGMVEAFVAAIEAVSPERSQAKSKDQRAKGVEPKVSVVWAQFGPYHLARLKALRAVFGEKNLLGVEIGSRTSTYAWERDPSLATGVVTLMPGQAAEDVSAAAIYQAALRVFKESEVDVVFVPSYWPASSLAVTLAARNSGARVVMMTDSHAQTAKAQGILAEVKRRLVLQFDAAFVAGKSQREYFESMGMNHSKIVTGYDVVDNDYFATCAKAARNNCLEVRARQGLPERYLLNVGRMIWKKNLETLVDAYKLVKERVGPSCPRLVLVGSGKLERSLRDRCLGHGLSVRQVGPGAELARAGDADVLFYGFKQAGELPEFYALADCFVLPSREEEWGLVVNEAMACGLPVLVSAVAGCARDLVRHGENGFMFQPFEASALADHLETIARQPEAAQDMGRASARMITGWSCETFAVAARTAASIALGGMRVGKESIQPAAE
jgi:glycosyltransferase involved in cell wall biosynthesis